MNGQNSLCNSNRPFGANTAASFHHIYGTAYHAGARHRNYRRSGHQPRAPAIFILSARRKELKRPRNKIQACSKPTALQRGQISPYTSTDKKDAVHRCRNVRSGNFIHHIRLFIRKVDAIRTVMLPTFIIFATEASRLPERQTRCTPISYTYT